MKIKNATTLAIELGKANSKNYDIELLGTESLSKVPNLATAVKKGIYSSSINSFLSVYGLDCKFFYSFEVDSQDNPFTERGIGYIEKQDNKFFLKRSRPLYFLEGGSMIAALRMRPIVCPDETNIIVSSYIPTSLSEVLADEHSVTVCETPHLPTSVALDKNSVLGRKDGPLESLEFSDVVITALKEHTKNLILKSPKLSVKSVNVNSIQLNSSKNAPEQKGTVYMDDKTRNLMFFDGSSWRRILTEAV